MRRLLPVAAALALVAGAGGSLPSRAAAPLPRTDFSSPYVAAFDGQLPTGDPWAKPRNSGEDATRTVFRKSYQSGVRWAYTWVPWSSVEKTPGTYDFTELDDYVGWARDEGILLRLQVMTGDWSRPQPWVGPLRDNPDHPGVNVPAVDLQPAVDYWAALVARYKPGGALSKARGWHDGYGVTRWEMENEPACIAWWGNWGRVPKDFAEFASRVSTRVHRIDPRIELSGPALAQGDDDCAQGGLEGSNWLRQALDARPSEWSSSTYRSSKTHPALGPYLDAFSWHYDNISLYDGTVPGRARMLRALVDSFSQQRTYPTRRGTPLWYSEGSALGYNTDNAKFATAQVQLMTILLAEGVQTMNLEPGTQINDASWPTTPMYGAQRTLTTYLPRAGEVRAANGLVDPKRVLTFVRTDPRTGLRTFVLWASGGAAGAGPAFGVDVPVATSRVEVVSSVDWKPVRQTVKGGHVHLTLHRDDPSPVFFVVERR